MKKILLTLIMINTMMLAAGGAELYNKCSGCHGITGEKKALGKSKVINELSKDDLVSFLKGYKDGSYGGPMKALMKSKVSDLSDDDIEALSIHITQLK